MSAPEGYTTLQIHKETLGEIRWVAEQLGLPGSKGRVVEDLMRWASTPEGLQTLRRWKAAQILNGGPVLSGPKNPSVEPEPAPKGNGVWLDARAVGPSGSKS
jgi:hypothetical protein